MASITSASSSQPIPSITIRSVTERAQRIYGFLTNGNFDEDSAIQEAEALYQDGIQLVAAEIRGEPLLDRIVSPVIAELNQGIPWTVIQNQDPIHQALSKAYRIFLELTWYQCYHKGRKIFADTQEAIYTISEKNLKVVPRNLMSVVFEYACAEQAAKCLTSTGSMLDIYSDYLLTIGESAESASLFGVMKGIKELVKEARKDWISGWYPDVHYLRWASIPIKTANDFRKIIKPSFEDYKEKGGKHTLCLTTIFMDLIRNSEVGVKTKNLAAKGIVTLVECHEEGRIQRIIEFFLNMNPHSRILKRALEEGDRYWETRILISQYAEDLAKDRKYDSYTNSIKEAFRRFLRTSVHEDEKRDIVERVLELKRGVAEQEASIQKSRELLKVVRTKTRATGEPTPEELEEAIKQSLEIKEETAEELEAVSLIQNALEKEQASLVRLVSSNS